MKEGKRKEAMLAGQAHYFTGKPCKHGHVDKRLTINGMCCECSRIKNNKRYESYYKQYAQENRDRIKSIMSNYQKNNKGKVNARTAARHAAKLQRTPKWLDSEEKWLIQETYTLASLRTKVTGIPWHVDHIVPLQGDIVSGLHVPENLRVVTATENCSKNNNWDWELQQ